MIKRTNILVISLGATLLVAPSGCGDTNTIATDLAIDSQLETPNDGGVDSNEIEKDGPVPPSDAGWPELPPITVMFHLNVQEYGWQAESAAIIEKALDLHETLNIPVEVSLTTWMVDLYAKDHSTLLQRLFDSPVVSMGYHLRPPKPYHKAMVNKSGVDWFGLGEMTETEQYEALKNYESKSMDLKTGEPTSDIGGFVKLTQLYGRAPYSAGISTHTSFQTIADTVFAELGLTFVISHSGASTLGKKRNDLYVKPEAIDVKVFQLDSSADSDACLDETDGGKLYDCEVAKCAKLTIPSCTVAFKMHDNDFIAEDSWWTTVYGGKKTPPWDPTQTATKLSDSAADTMWTRYVKVVQRAANLRAINYPIGSREWAQRLAAQP
jgi:hypothetical protein